MPPETDTPTKAPDVAIDLGRCDQEPIHVPGSIQAHGLLLVADASGRVVQCAGDPAAMLGADQVLGGDADALVAAAAQRFDISRHTQEGLSLIELEPAEPDAPTAATVLARLRGIAARLSAAETKKDLWQGAVEEVRALIGYDRVMIYRFLDDDSGCVVAEARSAGMESFLNHRYPASDIPKQARALYLRSLIRVIPDVGYRPAPLVPPLRPGDGPLDMSDCALRSVSPIHIQYLKNMGVAASASISIVIGGHLWGLIACHNGTPRRIPYALREVCTDVGQLLAQQIQAREESERHVQALALAERRDELMARLAELRIDDRPLIGDALAELPRDLRALIPCDGFALWRPDGTALVGVTPDVPQIGELAAWLLRRRKAGDVFATDSLSAHHAPAAAYAARASGLLACILSREAPVLLLWFRAEQVETVNWAGNPHKPLEPGATPGELTPRRSFELWAETVRGRAESWSPAEVEAAGRLRAALFDLEQRQTLYALNRQLRRTLAEKETLLEQKDVLMREVHHRVQNSLQLVSSMLQIQERGAPEEVRLHFEQARQRLIAVAAVHRRLWRSDQIHGVNFESYLRELRDGLVESWGATWDSHIRIHAAPIMLPTSEAVVLALIVTELLTNAVKYAYGGAEGPIDVTVKAEGVHRLRLVVADKGVGMQRGEREGGFGSKLTRGLIAQMKGEIAIEDNKPGTRVVLRVPHTVPRDTPAGG